MLIVAMEVCFVVLRFMINLFKEIGHCVAWWLYLCILVKYLDECRSYVGLYEIRACHIELLIAWCVGLYEIEIIISTL
jgi:hypothetical protein